MRFEIVLAPQAVEDLKRLSARLRSMVVDALETHLSHQPEKTSKSRIKRLRGIERPQFRLRVDELRVFYDVDEGRVDVLAVVAKSSAEEWLQREGRKS